MYFNLRKNRGLLMLVMAINSCCHKRVGEANAYDQNLLYACVKFTDEDIHSLFFQKPTVPYGLPAP